MLKWLLALLVIPLLDALFLIFVAAVWLGAVPTVALVVLTALVGMLFVRAEGRRTMRKIRRSMARGEPPTDDLIDGGLLIAAGAFLLTPGLITDAVGFLIVFPVTRYLIRAGLKRWVIVPYVDERTGGFATGEVYTFGFPDEDAFQGTADVSGDRDDYDLDADAYDVEFHDDSDDRES